MEEDKNAPAAVKTAERCNLCFKPTDDGDHKGGVCGNYERLKKFLEKRGGITVMA